MKYEIIRTDTADAGIRKIILYVAQNFGNTVALEKLDQIEKRILDLGDDPYIGTDPRYLVLKRQGYKVLVLEKDLVFYKIRKIIRSRVASGPIILRTGPLSHLLSAPSGADAKKEPEPSRARLFFIR